MGWGPQSLPGPWGSKQLLGALLQSTAASSLVLLGLGWGKEKECCLRLSCMPQLKKHPKVITWPCKFTLLWRSFEVAAVSEALEAKLVCSLEGTQLFQASCAGPGCQHRVGCSLCCEDKCSKRSGQGLSWKPAPAHSVSSWRVGWSGFWCSFCLWKGAGEGQSLLLWMKGWQQTS